MAEGNETISVLKEKFNKSLAVLQEKYPEMSFRPRSTNPSSSSKVNDISVEVRGKRVVVLHPDKEFPNGKLYTDYASAEDKRDAVLVDGRGADPEPESIFDKYRYRPKWDTGTKWVRCFDSYDDFLFEIEAIICRVLEIPMPRRDKGINTPIPPKAISEDGFVVVCPRCDLKFQHADRCPECGQLIQY